MGIGVLVSWAGSRFTVIKVRAAQMLVSMLVPTTYDISFDTRSFVLSDTHAVRVVVP